MVAVIEKAGQKPPDAELKRIAQAEPLAEGGSRPVRVCFLIGELAIGGTETQLLALIHHLDRERVQPYLVLLDGENLVSRSLEPADCPVLRFGLRRLRSLHALRTAWRLARFLRRERVDVLQLYLPDALYFGVLAGHLAGLKCIVRTRNNNNYWMTSTDRLLGRLLNRLVTLTLCNSEAARQAVLADERPNPDTVLVIENGVDLERFAHIPPVSAERDETRPRRVGIVANLRPIKGVDVFVRAAALVAQSHAGVTFHVAGEGPERPKLEHMIGELGLTGRFILHGSVDDIPGYLAQLDIAVLSSRAEGMPNAVLEYMAAGRAIIATAVGGATDLIKHQVHGLLVRPEDPEELAEAIARLVDNPRLASSLGLSGQGRAQSRHNRPGMARRFETFYDELARNDGLCPDSVFLSERENQIGG